MTSLVTGDAPSHVGIMEIPNDPGSFTSESENIVIIAEVERFRKLPAAARLYLLAFDSSEGLARLKIDLSVSRYNQ